MQSPRGYEEKLKTMSDKMEEVEQGGERGGTRVGHVREHLLKINGTKTSPRERGIRGMINRSWMWIREFCKEVENAAEIVGVVLCCGKPKISLAEQYSGEQGIPDPRSPAGPEMTNVGDTYRDDAY